MTTNAINQSALHQAAIALGQEARRLGSEPIFPGLDFPEPDPTAELIQLARGIRAWQESRRPRISNEQMLRLYPGLGSTKTYRRLADGDSSSLVIETQLARYRGVWAAIETLTGAHGGEEIYEDLTPTFECCVAVSGAIPQRGKTRLVLIEGPTGSGKSTALAVLEQKFAGQTARVEAHEGWQSLNCALRNLHKAIAPHAKESPKSTAEALDAIVAALNQARRVVLIDEAHHCTAAVLNSIKTILNGTDSVIVMAGIDTLWRKLAAKSWEEARQLIHNRLYERVRLAAPTRADAETFLSRRCPALNGGNWKQAAERVAKMSEHLGHYAFLRRIAERLNAESGEPDAAAILEAAATLKANLETR